MDSYHHQTNTAKHRREEVESNANQSRLANAITPKKEHQPLKRVMSAAGDLLINTGQRIKQASTPADSADGVAHNGVRDTQSMPAV